MGFSLIFFVINWFLLLFIEAIIWICTLVYQGKRKQWGWFIFTIIFHVVWIIYWIVWLYDPKLKRRNR
jgi:hypothetical protein